MLWMQELERVLIAKPGPTFARRALAAGLLVLALALAAGAAAPAAPRRPVAPPATYCRYDIDVRALPDAHARLGRIFGLGHATCPFITGQRQPVRLYTSSRTATRCDAAFLRGFRVVGAVRISLQDEQRGLRACMPFSRSTPTAARSPGKVYLLKAPAVNDPRNPNRIGLLAFLSTEVAGLPVYSLEVRGTGAAGYACFEMMRGAEVDPLAYLRSTGAPVPPGTTERLGVAPNCYMAYHLMGLR